MPKAPAAYERWQKNCANIDLTSEVYAPNAKAGTKLGNCARCGGPITVHLYIAPFSGSPAPEVKADPQCAVCRVDRVKRWGDLMRACPAADAERRATFPWPAPAPILQRHGMVQHDASEGAWELTEAGCDALAAHERGKP